MADSEAALKYLQETLQELLIILITIGLASQIHNTFSSRFTVDTLHGFGSSYAEIQRFECSAALQG